MGSLLYGLLPPYILIKTINISKKEVKMLYIDTLKTLNDLTDSGMDERQAKTLVSIFNDFIRNQFGHLVTKQDLDKTANECRAEIHEIKMEVKTIKSDIKIIYSEIKTIKWILGIFAGIVVATMVQHNLMH
jgi:archaellum component FlaC